jgi:hypothetical protein
MTRIRTGRVLLVLFSLLTGSAVAAPAAPAQDPQDPPPRDTIIVPIPPEVLRPHTVPGAPAPQPDTVPAVLRLPALGSPIPPGAATAVWEWSREELGRWHGLTALELVERVPGVVVTRGGWYGQQAGVASYGLGGGRFRIFINGFEFDGLVAATPDLQHISVVDLESLRVERGLLETRVYLRTYSVGEGRPFSQIEASTGAFGTRFIRGVFSTTAGAQATVTVGLDVTDTRGWLGEQPFTTNALLGRYSRMFGATTEVELEYRQAGLDWGGPNRLQADRSDLVLRGQTILFPGLRAFGHVGRSWRAGVGVDTVSMALSSVQAAAGADYRPWDGAALRGILTVRDGGRTGFPEPTFDATVEGSLAPLPWFIASGRARHLRIDPVSGAELEGTVRAGPFYGLSAFATAGRGTRGVGLARDTMLTRILEPLEGADPDTVEFRAFRYPVIGSTATGLRAGVEWTRGSARASAAYLVQDVDSVAPFGMRFDYSVAPVAASRVSGYEIFGSVPLLTPALRFEGSYTNWGDVGFRPYFPDQLGRGALVFSRNYYEGNLEPTLRVETFRRGSSLVPNPERSVFTSISQPYIWTNLFLQIRILDVRAFFVWENIQDNRLAEDLPGRTLGGQRFYYGVRWHFLD